MQDILSVDKGSGSVASFEEFMAHGQKAENKAETSLLSKVLALRNNNDG